MGLKLMLNDRIIRLNNLNVLNKDCHLVKPILGADHALYDNKHLLQNDMYSFGILMPGI